MLTITIVFSAAIAFATGLNNGQIYGGETVSIQNFPYQVQLNYNNAFTCGGSVLSKYTILTAAHCFDNRPLDGDKYGIRAGSNLLGGGVLKSVSNIERHPSYQTNNVDYDIAIITLSTPLEFSDSIKAVPLATSQPNLGKTCRVAGWGRISSSSTPAAYLQAINMYKSLDSVCRLRYLLTLTNRMTCYTGTPGKNVCNGDSGGPLVCDDSQVGIVSYGQGCTTLGSVVFTDVPHLRNWIEPKIKH